MHFFKSYTVFGENSKKYFWKYFVFRKKIFFFEIISMKKVSSITFSLGNIFILLR